MTEQTVETERRPETSAKPSFSRVLANRAFALLWLGQIVSQSGDYIFDVVALWIVLQLPDPIFKVGLTTASILVPGVIVGPFAGVYIDRFNRRDIMIAANTFQAAVAGVIAVLNSTGSLSFPILLGLLILLNAGAQFVRPAVSAAIPRLAQKEDLAAANGLFSLSSSINQVAGFGLGGIIVLLFGTTIPIYYDSLTFIVAALACGLIARSTLAVSQLTSLDSSIRPPGPGFLTSLSEGLAYIRSSRLLIELVILAAFLNFFAGGIQTLIGPYSKITLNGTSATYGALLVGLSVGTLVGSVLIGKVNARAYVGKLLFIGVLTTALAVIGLGLVNILPISIALMLTIGFALAFANLPIQVLLQVKVPSQLMGRVITTLVAIVTTTTPVAALATGSIAQSLTTGPTLVLFGGLMTATTVGGYFGFREIREATY